MGRFKKGDRVIINPNIPDGTWSEHGYAFHCDSMRKPGIFTLGEEHRSGGFYINDYVYDEKWLLPAPLFNVGDKVQIKPDLTTSSDVRFTCNTDMEEFAGKTVTISHVDTRNYTPDKMGEDGCLYYIEEDENSWSWSSPMFVTNSKKDKQIKIIKNGNEDQLQKEGIAVSRGDQHEGSRICCRRCKAAITVGHLSHQEVSGE